MKFTRQERIDVLKQLVRDATQRYQGSLEILAAARKDVTHYQKQMWTYEEALDALVDGLVNRADTTSN